jgi:hypothetical protein
MLLEELSFPFHIDALVVQGHHVANRKQLQLPLQRRFLVPAHLALPEPLADRDEVRSLLFVVESGFPAIEEQSEDVLLGLGLGSLAYLIVLSPLGLLEEVNKNADGLPGCHLRVLVLSQLRIYGAILKIILGQLGLHTDILLEDGGRGGSILDGDPRVVLGGAGNLEVVDQSLQVV